jgi:hypothetical protein
MHLYIHVHAVTAMNAHVRTYNLKHAYALAFRSVEIPPDYNMKLRESFDLFDADMSGTLDKSELKTAMRTVSDRDTSIWNLWLILSAVSSAPAILRRIS